MTNNIPDLNFFLQKGLMLDAQQGFADAFNRLLYVLQNIKGDGITIQSVCSADGLITFSMLNPSGVVHHPRPFDLDLSDPQTITVRNAIVPTGYMVGSDTFPVVRVIQFADPDPISCAVLSAGSDLTLWYLMTQVESELAAQNATNCKLSVDPDADDPDHLLFRLPLYIINVTSVPDEEGSGPYQFVVKMDLRNSTPVRLS